MTDKEKVLSIFPGAYEYYNSDKHNCSIFVDFVTDSRLLGFSAKNIIEDAWADAAMNPEVKEKYR